ncbi:MAG TPA: BatA domain-containing protein [Tepidisphaeraceae bacterium]|nr:BatA domain-containing protein [Tepidisphaeraceae bacterium]
MHFLLPILLIGTAGAIVPLLIHWLHRRRARRFGWGAMQFLETPSRSVPRRKNVEQWLLLAVRMLVVVAFALMLAGPRVRAGRLLPAFGSGPPIDLVMIMDDSPSSGRSSGGRTVFDRQIEAASQVLRELRSDDTVGVVLAGHAPRALRRPLQASDDRAIEQLQNQLQRRKPGLTDCSIPDAVAAAGELLQTGANARKVILVLSDHQRLKWQVGDESAWEAAVALAGHAEIVSLPILPDAQFASEFVEQISVEPKLVGPGRPIRIGARIRNSGTKPPAARSARVSIDGRDVAIKPVETIALGSTTTVDFQLQNGAGALGSHVATVSLDSPGALPADNQVSTAINVLPALPVLIIDGQFSDAGGLAGSRFLQAAMQPDALAMLEPKVISLRAAASEDLNRYACVVLNDCPTIPPVLRDRLVEYTQSGRGVWCILGQRTRKSLIENDLATTGLLNATGATTRSANVPPVISAPNHPIIAAVAGNERNALAGAQVHQWWSLHPADGDARVLLATPDGDPLVLEHPVGSAGGTFILWTTAPDGAWNNLHVMPIFVPLVAETVLHLIAPQLHGLENHGLIAGEPIQWVRFDSLPPGKVRVTLPDGTPAEREPTLVNGRWLLTFPDTFSPGIYRLSFPDAAIAPVNYAVNIDPRALDATALDRDDIAWLIAHRALDVRQPTISPNQLDSALHRPNEIGLWEVLGALVAGLLALETWLGRRMTARAVVAETGSSVLSPAQTPQMARRIA